jgi:hypothetical protein
MSDQLLESIRRMAREGKLPDEVTPELTFAAIMDTNIRSKRTNERLDEIDKTVKRITLNDLPHISHKIDDIKKTFDENPSLIWLMRYRTPKTLKTLIAGFLLLLAVAIVILTVPSIRFFVFSLLGLPEV